MTKTETVKRGHFLKFDEDLTPYEVSKLGDRIYFHVGFMALNVATGRQELAQDQLAKLLKISEAMRDGGDYQL